MSLPVVGNMAEFSCAILLAVGGTLILQALMHPRAAGPRRVAPILYGVLAARYLEWRFSKTLVVDGLNWWSLVGWVLWIFEVLNAFIVLHSQRGLGAPTNRSPPQHATPLRGDVQLPLVDVFLPTYNESWEILEPTVLAALRLRHSRFRVWVLDDGRRAWLEERCREVGVGYLRREENTHFKAGNLNNALRHVLALPDTPDFIVVLDADFIVFPEFLERTMPLMANPRIAIVQTPQTYYNQDPFQYAFGVRSEWPDDMRDWFGTRLPVLDAVGAATCCGTSFLLRVAALKEAGGFPTDSICEDTLLSIKLKTMGWQTAYLNEVLSLGLNAEGLSEYLTQRARWCMGGVQINQWRWRALGKSLRLRERVAILESIGRTLVPPSLNLMWAAAPIMYWATNHPVIDASAEDMVLYALPLVAYRMLMTWMCRGAELPIVTDAAWLLTAPLLLLASFRALLGSKNIRFGVTPKGVSRNAMVVHWKPLAWLAAIAVPLALTAGIRFAVPSRMTMDSRFFLWTVATTVVSLLTLLVAMVPCFERPKHRRYERFPTSEGVLLRSGPVSSTARLVDLSLGGAWVQGATRMAVGDPVQVMMSAPRVEVLGVVVRVAGEGLGVAFKYDRPVRDALVQRIYCSKQYVNVRTSWQLSDCLLAMSRRLTQ